MSGLAARGSLDAVAVQSLVDELLELLPDLLHDWLVLAEFDGAYALQRCRVCGTEVVR